MPEHPAESGLSDKPRGTPSVQAVKRQKNDEELAKMAEEVKNQPPETPPPSEGEKGEGQTPAAEPAPAETKPPTEGDELSDEEVGQLKPKAQKRFQKMDAELKRLRAEREQWEQAQELAPPPQQPRTAFPWDQPQEITQEQYEADVEARAQRAAQRQVFVEKTVTNYESDLKTVESKYPELNEDHDAYDEDLAQTISETWMAQLRQNPLLRLSDHVERVMGVMKKGEERGRQAVTGKIVRQEAEQALSPSGGSRGEAAPEEAFSKARTIEELDKAAERMFGKV